MQLERLKTVSDIVATWVGLVALIAGAAFTLNEYREKQAQDRRRASMEMLERFHSDRIQNAHWKVSGVWSVNVQLLKEAAAQGESFDSVVLAIVDLEQLSESVTTLLDFYEVAAVCASVGVCDTALMHAFFKPDALAFYNMHYPLIDHYRTARNDPTYGCELEAFIRGRSGLCKD